MKRHDGIQGDSDFNIEGWHISPPFQERLEVNGLELFMSGFQGVHPDFGEVTGSAVDLENFPHTRAWYELVERISIVESMINSRFTLKNLLGLSVGAIGREVLFPGPGLIEKDGTQEITFQYAKSNGVALYTNWADACRKACLELLERHLVLSTWVGLTKIETFPIHSDSISKLAKKYDALGISFGSQAVSCFPETIFASGCILLPKQASSALVFGFGSGMSRDESMRKAEQETLQRMAFLWGEPIPAEQPKFQATRQYHDDYYLNPAARFRIDQWLSGKHFRNEYKSYGEIFNIEFADLSSPKRPQFYVAKAISEQAIPLVFGKWREGAFSLVDEELLIHPIP